MFAVFLSNQSLSHSIPGQAGIGQLVRHLVKEGERGGRRERKGERGSEGGRGREGKGRTERERGRGREREGEREEEGREIN